MLRKCSAFFCFVLFCFMSPFFIKPFGNYLFNPFIAPACKISEQKKNAHIHTCKQCIWWSCNKSAFSIVHFDRSPFTCSCEGMEKILNNFKFGTFIGRFPNGDSTSMAMKGLSSHNGPAAFPLTPVYCQQVIGRNSSLYIIANQTKPTIYRLQFINRDSSTEINRQKSIVSI